MNKAELKTLHKRLDSIEQNMARKLIAVMYQRVKDGDKPVKPSTIAKEAFG